MTFLNKKKWLNRRESNFGQKFYGCGSTKLNWNGYLYFYGLIGRKIFIGCWGFERSPHFSTQEKINNPNFFSKFISTLLHYPLELIRYNHFFFQFKCNKKYFKLTFSLHLNIEKDSAKILIAGSKLDFLWEGLKKSDPKFL